MILATHTKQPGESYKVAVDFAKRLQSGEALATPTVTSKKVSDGSDSSGTIVSQVAVSGTKVEARLAAGTHGDDHTVQYRSTTNLGNTYEDEITLLIREE